jgi:molybdenum-dependent DNA-binding transcriptional regulator ModE
MHSFLQDYEGWGTEGKPTRDVQFDGDQYATAFDYDENGLDQWENPDFQIETPRDFRFYFVAKDSPHYSGETADSDPRVQGGTITVRPRWPDMTSDGKPVRGVPELGGPYIDVQIQASNIPHEQYRELAQRVISAYPINSRYFDAEKVHPMSNVQDLAYYARLRRGSSGPIFAADGPISRIHNVIQGDRSGYRKHVEDHRKIPGYYITSQITGAKAPEMVRGHELGKEVKHYYPNHPDEYDPDEAPHHPKLEVSYQTSTTDDTVYWDELKESRRELEETALNVLEWSGIATDAAADVFVTFDPFWDVENTHEARRIVSDPLPEIKDEQEARVMDLWGDMTGADRDVTELLLSDGGTVEPKEAAEKTGNSYRTIRRVIDRMEGMIDHHYGEMEIVSKHVQQQLLERVRAAGDSFETAIGSAMMDLADAADERVSTMWGRIRREYSITVRENVEDCRQLLKIGYQPADYREAMEMTRRIRTALQDAGKALYGVAVEVRYQDGSSDTFRHLHRKTAAKTYQAERPSPEAREKLREIYGDSDTDDTDADDEPELPAHKRLK